jgi:hypothetical protein
MTEMNTRIETVLSLFEGTITERDAALRHGVSETEIQEWKAFYVASARNAAASGKRFGCGGILGTKKRVALWVAALLILCAGGVTAATASLDCADGLICFSPNTPAKASEVNSNFSKMATWVEEAVGPIDNPVIQTIDQAVSINGELSANGDLSAASANLTGNLTAGATTLESATINGSITLKETDTDIDTSNGDVSMEVKDGRLQIINMSLCDCVNFGDSTLFQNSQMYECPENRVLTGIFSTGSTSAGCDGMHCLEYYKCCRVCGFQEQTN